MNIRTVTNPILPTEVNRAKEARTVRTEFSSEDRDADGRREQKDPNKNPLDEEELKKAQAYLENVAGLKANDLKLEVEMSRGLRTFLIKDKGGNVVRRILEWEMRPLIVDKDKKTGQIFDKSA